MNSHLTENDDAVLYVVERFSSPTTKAPTNDEILMLLCLLEMRGQVEQVWRISEEGKQHAKTRNEPLTPQDAALLVNAREMAARIYHT